MDIDKLTEKLIIAEKVPETTDAFSISFEIPPTLKDKFAYEAGQFVTLFLDINGQQVRRSYSLCSSPDWDKDFRISVKRVPGGLVSNYLADHVSEGEALRVTPPAGRFTLPKTLNKSSLLFFAAGSGVTPIIAMIKSALKRSSDGKVYLLYANRDERSIMFQRQLAAINAEYHERFRFEYALSQPFKPWDGIKGRLTAPAIKEFLTRQTVPQGIPTYMCGPEGFMATVEATLTLNGFLGSQVHKESFVSPSPAATSSITSSGQTSNYLDDIGPGAVLIGDKNLAAAPKTISVTLNGDHIEVPAIPGQSVLETLLEAGYSPPYSCMDGACMACLGKVKKGLVYQNDMGILTEDNTEIGECLTCQAKPASETVDVDYDL